ncbi:hypothetical protein JTE90_012804 [Oedothorax gibbosus]|uniref:Uncharacterized protein n=1 Tax=Oedothorax gibbosus TaxID=931172 RepID=A0AAV6W356_9ARAC|nr:hypothetical protein JTE90_012804 [Oedothorax gibbosus]
MNHAILLSGNRELNFFLESISPFTSARQKEAQNDFLSNFCGRQGRVKMTDDTEVCFDFISTVPATERCVSVTRLQMTLKKDGQIQSAMKLI